MTIDRSWEFQTLVFGAVAGALPDVPGFSSQPSDPPDRFWRLDGWTTGPVRSWKNLRQVRHAFTLHVFDAPARGAGSLEWVKTTIATAHAALEEQRLGAGWEPLRHEAGSASFDDRADGVRDAHAFIRYAATIGG